MREQQFIRFVEQICFLLKLSQPCSKTALQYFLQFKQYEGHQFDHQIMIASCIYLSTKIFEQQVRVRDILNMIYVLTRVYKVARSQQEQKQQQVRMRVANKERHERSLKQSQIEDELKQQRLGLNEGQQKQNIISQVGQQQKGQHAIISVGEQYFESQKIHQQQNHPITQINRPQHQQQINPPYHQQQQHHKHNQQQQHHTHHTPPQFILLNQHNHNPHHNFYQQTLPQYSLSDYNEYKSKIIQAQQTLLRILGFDFLLAQKNKTELKQLLLTMHYLHVPATVAQSVMKVYNDVHYVDVQLWLEGVVYFGYLLVKNMVETKQQQILSDKGHHYQDQRLQQQQKPNKNKNKTKQPSQKQLNETKRIKQFITKMSTPQQWQYVLCTSIKQLQNYAEKLTNFYLSIEIN